MKLRNGKIIGSTKSHKEPEESDEEPEESDEESEESDEEPIGPETIHVSNAEIEEVNGKYKKDIFRYCGSPHYSHVENESTLFYLCGWMISTNGSFVYEMEHEDPDTDISKTLLPSKNKDEWSYCGEELNLELMNNLPTLLY